MSCSRLVHPLQVSDTFWKPVCVLLPSKVSRIEGRSEAYDTELVLDINSEIYPVSADEVIDILITERLEDAQPNPDEPEGYNPTKPLGDRADAYEYIMHGKIFKYHEERQRA